jgi:magnesium-transporting ATPase (P-type)
LHSHHARGLAVADAVQRKAVFGANVMTPGKQHGLLKKVWDQVANILVVILLAAAIVAGILKDWVELGFILGVVVVNIVIGVVREFRVPDDAASTSAKHAHAGAVGGCDIDGPSS